MKLVIATHNKHKLKEIRDILSDLPIEIIGLDKFPQIKEIEEDGITFEANALKKARVVFKEAKTWTLADDSGLQVDALGGAPGVYSARYAGEGASYEQICQKLLNNMKEVSGKERTARFNCTMALIEPSGEEHVLVGICEGKIGHEMKGEHGFGYDPVFVYKGETRTLAEMPPKEKNKISHRARALEKIHKILKKYLKIK